MDRVRTLKTLKRYVKSYVKLMLDYDFKVG